MHVSNLTSKSLSLITRDTGLTQDQIQAKVGGGFNVYPAMSFEEDSEGHSIQYHMDKVVEIMENLVKTRKKGSDWEKRLGKAGIVANTVYEGYVLFLADYAKRDGKNGRDFLCDWQAKAYRAGEQADEVRALYKGCDATCYLDLKPETAKATVDHSDIPRPERN